MRIYVVLMRTGSADEPCDNYIASFTGYHEAAEFIYKESGEKTRIHSIERDLDGFHYYITYLHGYKEERFDIDIYGILSEENI